MRRHSILLIDDEESIRVAISRNLQKKGYEVHTAENGADGIEMMKKTQNIRLIYVFSIEPFAKVTLWLPNASCQFPSTGNSLF